MRRNIHYKPSKSASILSGVIACAMGVFGLFTIPSSGAMTPDRMLALLLGV